MVAAIVMELRWFLGSDLNRANDSLTVADFDYRWTPPFVNGRADPRAMRKDFDRTVLPRLLPGGRWGWKHNPSAHLLPFYTERFPGLRFLHVIRDGRDSVASQAGALVHARRLGRALLDGDPTPMDPKWDGEHIDARRVAGVWAGTHRVAADFGERHLGDRYLRVRLEDLVSRPKAEVGRIARFLGSADVLRPATALVTRPASMGRGQGATTDVVEEMRDGLERFGYLD